MFPHKESNLTLRIKSPEHPTSMLWGEKYKKFDAADEKAPPHSLKENV